MKVKRDSWWGMMKEGRYRAFRNLSVGWVLQILHSTDRTERWIRIVLELVVLLSVYWYMTVVTSWGLEVFWVLLVIVHSLSWYFFGNFWVYMLDSFLWVKNPGIKDVLNYIDDVKRIYSKTDSIDAILVYGSMCRSVFHGRSDLDLRVVRRPGVWNAISSVLAGLLIRIPAAIKRNPVDFQVVDSIEFLRKQMRDDEAPIIVYVRPDCSIPNPGSLFEDVLNNPSMVLRDKVDIKE